MRIVDQRPNSPPIQPLGLSFSHLDTSVGMIQYICEMTKRKVSGATFAVVPQTDGTIQFVGSPCHDERVRTLVSNLKRGWEIGGARSVSRDTFEPQALQAAYAKIKAERNPAVWKRMMQRYLCVRFATLFVVPHCLAL